MASVSPKRSPLQKKKSKDECKDACMNAINNNVLRASPRRQAVLFAEWYRQLVDQDRSSLCLYFSDNAVLQWFGRTIKTKKKISDFLKYDLNCSSHRFSAVEVCPPIIMYFRPSTEVLATPLDSDTPSGILNAGIQRVSLRSVVKRTRSPFSSPDSPGAIASKKSKITKSPSQNVASADVDLLTNTNPKTSREKVKSVTLLEEGQGDCLPSTSGADCRRKRADVDLYSQLPHSYIEARCVIEFTKTRVKRGADILKWERQCKLQVAYAEDPVYEGEYIIWTVVYSENNKCRRNLLAAFNACA